MSAQTERLGSRFGSIRAAISMTHGQDAAFCAAMAAWLMLIEAITQLVLRKVQADPEIDLAIFNAEIKALLMSIHADICEHIDFSTEQALELSMHFNEVVMDITAQKG